MPYGVADALWRMLPADDQAALKAGYDAAQASQPPPPPAPAAAAPPAAAGDALIPPGTVRPVIPPGVTAIPAPPAVQPTPPAPAPPVVQAPQQPGASVDFGSDTGDEVTLELFSVEAPDRNEPGGAAIRLPSTAWGDFRDYFARDQPFLGTHIRSQGKQLRGVVASDLWSPST